MFAGPESETDEQRSLETFTRRVFRPFQSAAHIRTLIAALEDAVETPDSRLIVTLPPRHSKSLNVSEHLPAWYLGRFPDKRIIAASHTASLSYTFSRRVRNKMDGPRWPFPNVRVADDKGAVSAWDIAGHLGGYVSVGVGGSPTGQGGNCFPAGTRVLTEYGMVDIQHLVRLQYQCKVLGLDHGTGSPVWRRIEAARELVSDDIYEITTTAGRSFRATGNHRVYLDQSGYREARLLRPGDRLAVSVQSFREDLPGVRSYEGRARSILQGMRVESPNGDVRVPVCSLRGGGGATPVRIPQDAIAWRTGSLLRRILSSRGDTTAQHGGAHEVLYLRQSDPTQPREILLGRLRETARTTTNACRSYMRHLRSIVSSGEPSHAVLLSRMRECGARIADDWAGQLKLQGRNQLCAMVPGYASVDLGTRPASLRDVRARGSNVASAMEGTDNRQDEPACSSHRRECSQQLGWESHYSLRNLPQATPRIGTDTVAVVRRVHTGRIPVYDIQVAGCRNFFAEEILVHNCIIIDDPIRSQQDADSQTVRDALWEWYQGTLYTRLEPGGSIVLTATRWHDDDLTGRLLDAQAHGGDQWRHVHMPAISDDGTALWPERWSVAALERIRQAVGSKVFEAQYQGRPVPGEGGTFKHDWWQRYRELPEIVRLEIAVDSAFKTGTANDYSVFAAWGVSRLDNAYLLNVFRERVAFPDLIRLGYAAVDWAKGSFPFLEPLLVVEDQASGQSAIQMWESGEQGNRSLSVVPFPVAGQGSKLSRAEGVSPFVEGKRAYIPQDDMFPWVADWLLEHDRFPSGKHDDQVDTTAIALSRLLANSAGDFSDLDAYYDRQLGRR